MNEPFAYLNHRFVPQSEAGLSLHDAGFVMGVTVTDMCRTVRHKLFRLADHLDRFCASCDAAFVPRPRSIETLSDLATELVSRNCSMLAAEADLALVLFATPGPIGFYLGESGGVGDGAPTFGMHTFPLPFHRYRRLFEQGARLVIPSVRQLPAECVPPQLKQRSRMNWWLAEREVRRSDRSASALLVDAAGNVTETAAANFLIVRDGAVQTPRRESVLSGVSLKITEEICRSLSIPFEERVLTVDDCLRSQEASLTSTPYGIASVRSINGTELPCPGPTFERLRGGWNERAGLDLRRQILSNQ